MANDRSLGSASSSDDRQWLDRLLERFEEAWERGEAPDITALLPAEPARRWAALEQLVPMDLERRLRRGENVQVEAYLERFPELRDDSERVLSLCEVEYRWRRGDNLRDDLVRRFPHLREPLLGRLSTLPGGGASPIDPPTLPGTFGRYRIVRRLGRGAMGTVYLAYDTHLQRPVALKVSHFTAAAPHLLVRFLQEAQVAAVLHHPNLCPVYEAAEVEGIPYLTMPYIDGRPLTDVYPPPLADQRQAAALVRTLALGMHHAHERHVVHRDLKPSNILVTAEGHPFILDWGLALRLRSDSDRDTQFGCVLGAPGYMPPEQARGDLEAMGPRSDIYSLGVILYELLAGRRPFLGRVESILRQVVFEEPEPPGRYRAEALPHDPLDGRLEAICRQAMAKRPEDRFPDMVAFARELSAWLDAAAPAAVPVPPPTTPADPRVARDVLQVLREWGWEMGLSRLRRELEQTEEPGRRAALRVLLGWLAGDRGFHGEAREQLRAAEADPALAGWALAGQAFVALRERDFHHAAELFRRAAAANPADVVLQGVVSHGRGSLAHHEGRFDDALAELHAALEHLGPDAFGSGRVLDTLGMVHAARNHLALAEEFFAAALERKQRCDDEAGVTLTHGQLGRLHLAQGRLDQADQEFRQAIDLTRRTGDERGEAQLYNHRGQAALEQGRLAEAASLLDESIRLAHGRWPIVEGFARKDRARVHLAGDERDQADAACAEAWRLFEPVGFAEGLAHVRWTRGLVRQAQGRHGEAIADLRAAARHFELHHESDLAALALLDLARVQRQSGAAELLATETLLAALEQAERSRRGRVVAAVEAELPERDRLRRRLERLTGRRAADLDGPWDLDRGDVVPATVLAVGLRADAAPGPNAAQPGRVRNHLAEMIEPVLRRHGGCVVQFGGDGFLAIIPGSDSASRGVAAARAVLGLLKQFNRPRRVLGWPAWQAAIGLASGPVGLGWAGTYTKRDAAATGPAVEAALGLRSVVRGGSAAVAESTLAWLPAAEAASLRGPVSITGGLSPQKMWELPL